MKKIVSIAFIIIAIFIMPIISNAASEPIYDETFNNGLGAFYANGTAITIKQDTATNNTIVEWNGNSKIIPSTTTILGGGAQGTNYETSNIIMESGTIAFIYGGGFSTLEDQSADVGNSNITVNGGTVTGSVIGGGLLYSKVGESNVIINNGNIASVQGGGLASATISGTNYNTGTAENPKVSFTRVDNANITINGGTINSNSLGYGLVYGGGQGYSYTGNANLNINGGDMSTAYVTAGGSNGYTGNANVNITGGDINIYQSVNRGQIDSAKTTVTGGTINSLYIGGETGDSSVTGTIENNASVNILGGNVQNFEKGTNGGQELVVDNNKFSAVSVAGTVTNNDIGQQDVEITYTIKIDKPQTKIYKNQTEKLNVIIQTEPSGYENLFANEPITWTSDDNNIATVDSDGLVTGVNTGSATITATLNNQTATAQVDVANNFIAICIISLLLIFLAFLITLIIIFALFE